MTSTTSLQARHSFAPPSQGSMAPQSGSSLAQPLNRSNATPQLMLSPAPSQAKHSLSPEPAAPQSGSSLGQPLDRSNATPQLMLSPTPSQAKHLLSPAPAAPQSGSSLAQPLVRPTSDGMLLSNPKPLQVSHSLAPPPVAATSTPSALNRRSGAASQPIPVNPTLSMRIPGKPPSASLEALPVEDRIVPTHQVKREHGDDAAENPRDPKRAFAAALQAAPSSKASTATSLSKRAPFADMEGGDGFVGGIVSKSMTTAVPNNVIYVDSLESVFGTMPEKVFYVLV
jgi:hypothetical protein